MYNTAKKFILGSAVAATIALPLTVHAADATSFNPTTVKVTAKPISSIPVGTIISWPVAQNPADWQNPDGSFNWLECNGQTISQAAYPELFALMGGKVPDLRGLFLRGVGGSSAALGVIQGDAIRNVTGTFDSRVAGMWREGTGPFRVGESGGHKVSVDGGGYPYSVSFDLSRSVPTAEENRPVNQAVRYLIRARP